MTQLTVRKATRDDIPEIIAMLADDHLGKNRENSNNLDKYYQAFQEIEKNPDNELLMLELDRKKNIGTVQLTIISSLSFQGGKRGLIESVRIKREFRGMGYGRQFMRLVIDRAKERGCYLMQLSTNRDRPDARRFYESLGFHATHIGMKLLLAE